MHIKDAGLGNGHDHRIPGLNPTGYRCRVRVNSLIMTALFDNELVELPILHTIGVRADIRPVELCIPTRHHLNSPLHRMARVASWWTCCKAQCCCCEAALIDTFVRLKLIEVEEGSHFWYFCHITPPFLSTCYNEPQTPCAVSSCLKCASHQTAIFRLTPLGIGKQPHLGDRSCGFGLIDD